MNKIVLRIVQLDNIIIVKQLSRHLGEDIRFRREDFLINSSGGFSLTNSSVNIARLSKNGCDEESWHTYALNFSYVEEAAEYANKLKRTVEVYNATLNSQEDPNKDFKINRTGLVGS